METTRPPTETPGKTVDSESFTRKQAAFKLYFPIKCDIGRSRRSYTNPVPVITSKFYSKEHSHLSYKESDLQNVIKNKLKLLEPKEKYETPLTESQRYGWYKIQLQPIEKADKRLNFAKNTHQLVKEHLMNYKKIR